MKTSKTSLLRIKKLTTFVFLIIFSIFIIVWQSSYYNNLDKGLRNYGRKDATGFSHRFAKKFIYFYYYLGYYPIVTPDSNISYTKLGAENALEENGPELLMEYNHFSRLGESSRMFLFIPNAIADGSPEFPSIKLFNAIIFITTLLAVLWLFYLNRRTLLGIILVIIFGSSPFLLHEVYGNENIFYLLISGTLLFFSLNLPFLKTTYSFKWDHLLVPLLCGIVIGFFADVRSEINILLALPILAYIFVFNTNIIKKSSLILIFFLSFFSTKAVLKNYFDIKFEQAQKIVNNLGGHPYNGRRISTHTIWHPIFCGLGDFDTKYGYKWKDATAYAYAKPHLKFKYNINLNWHKYQMTEYWDTAKKYYKKPELIPEYEDVLRAKVLGDITNDPKWFIEIIIKRINVIFSKTVPLFIFNMKIPFFNGWWSLLILFPLIIYKKWFELKLVLFSMPLMATSIMIYSAENTTYNSIFHLILFAIFTQIALSKLVSFVYRKYA